MTLRMLDSVSPQNLPPGADAYAGYVDGRFANVAAIKARFPGKPVLAIAVFAADDAEAADCETGDMSPFQIAGWVKRQQARGAARPVVYASISQMPAVLAALAAGGVTRGSVRCWSAHYGQGKHICPGMDGTQWTDQAAGVNGTRIDESVLLDDFFQEAPVALTNADAKLVWTVDGPIANPNANPKNPSWTAAQMLEDIDQRVRALQAATAAAFGQDDPAALAKAILAGLDPAAIASAVAAAVGPDVAQEVVTALAAQLGK